MGRKHRVRELRAVEARLEARYSSLHENATARMRYLRALHPAWLAGGGFVSGVLVERLVTRFAGSETASKAVSRGMRLWPLLSSAFPAGLLMGKPAP